MDNTTDYINSLTQTISLGHKKRSLLNWTFFFAFVGPMLSILVLFAMSITGIERPPSWINWILFIVFVPLIITSLVMVQRKELVGSYGETILILIPTFVWLLPSHYLSIKYLLIISAIIVFLGGISYMVGIFRKVDKDEKNYKSKLKATNILLRLAFVASSVISTVSISIILINWGDISLKLPLNQIDENDYTTTPWILFIAIITILVALLLILLGLVSNHSYKVLSGKSKSRADIVARKHANTFIKKTVIVDIKSKRKRERFLRKIRRK